VYTIRSRNNASIFNFSILFDGKVDIVSALASSKFPVFFSGAEKKRKNINYPLWYFTHASLPFIIHTSKFTYSKNFYNVFSFVEIKMYAK